MEIVSVIPDSIKKLATDSRRISRRDIADGHTAFVALKTAVGDGHKYVRSLYDVGLRTFVVNSTREFKDLEHATFVEVPGDTLDFMIAEAGKRLAHTHAGQIVITGSNRKTTVKELVTIALKKQGLSVARSPRTWNSAMGIALSLFDNISAGTRYIVTEAGIDAPGQSDYIKPMLRPEIGVITSITDEHDENFTNHAEKIAEKVKIVKNAGKIIYDDSDPELVRQIEALNHPNTKGVKGVRAIVEEVTGTTCPDIEISTNTEIRSVPYNGVMIIDSFTNDLESLPLSINMAEQRRGGRHLCVLLGNFDGDRAEAENIVKDFLGKTIFFDGKSQDLTQRLHRDSFENTLLLLKGADSELITFFDEARHDTTMQIDLDALVNNFNVYRRLLPFNTDIVCMVKADAYGHGALEIAKTVQSHGASHLAVAVIDEGVSLRRAGVTMPVIVLNPITNNFEALAKYNLEPAVFSLHEIDVIERGIQPFGIDKPLKVHIKYDSGMHRVGFTDNHLDSLAQMLNDSRRLTPVSVFSHLATADCPGMDDYVATQIAKFDKFADRLSDALSVRLRKHILNTAGIATLGKTSASYDMARLGLGLYGISPVENGADRGLKPVARLVTTVISVKSWPEGTPIGYGCKGVTSRPSVIATLPIGYADGIDRRLGNGNVSFFINGTACPTIGNICMDLLMIDVTEAVRKGVEVSPGTEVEIFGKYQSASDIARILDTIPYEILTSISPRVRRTYHQR